VGVDAGVLDAFVGMGFAKSSGGIDCVWVCEQVLNVIVKDRFQGHPVKEKKLKEILGHTPLQVFAGAIVGIVVGYLCRKA
jgi:acid phosphatase family membrane protein YuiD